MGIGVGDRVLINDEGMDGRTKAFAASLPRNKGLKEFDLNKTCMELQEV